MLFPCMCKLVTRLTIVLVVSCFTPPSLQNAINVCARKHITSIKCLPNNSQANSIYYVKYEKGTSYNLVILTVSDIGWC